MPQLGGANAHIVTVDRNALPLAARRLPVGAEVTDAGTDFRVWAPASATVHVVTLHDDGTDADVVPLTAEADGYFRGRVADAPAGTRYWFKLQDGHRYADPASRFQPDGPQGPSQVIDPATFRWSDNRWPGITETTPVVYEMHVGTFTKEGTLRAAARQLPALAECGVSIIEILPLAEFPGEFGWGYDGVLWFAPTRLYGAPDDVRQFIDDAHALGIGVILDVVYNHFGPDGCYLDRFSPAYFTDEVNDWGRGINFDGPQSEPVREFITANARYWIEEFHFDGLRLDATQAITDTRRPHILTEIATTVRDAAGARGTWIVAENEPQHTWLLHPVTAGGAGLNALWNDDFHHSAMVALTGRREAYYTDYLGTPQEFISAAKYGYLYQGQWYRWQHQPRGTWGGGLPPWAFVAFLQNHDQVANSRAGLRVHQLSSPAKCRAMTALLLLGPWTPQLFQGQEFSASTPFLYFADHHGELGDAVRLGRREFLTQFPSLVPAEVADAVPVPNDPQTFHSSKLDHGERERHRPSWELHRDLIALRRRDAAFAGRAGRTIDGAVLAPQIFVLRFMPAAADGDRGSDRLLVVNLGAETLLDTLADPLVSPFPWRQWQTIWSSEAPQYGGGGTPELVQSDGWRLSAECALVLAPDKS